MQERGVARLLEMRGAIFDFLTTESSQMNVEAASDQIRFICDKGPVM